MEKRKRGVYAQYFEIFGLDERGRECWFLIDSDQAKNYPQAINFFKKTWGNRCKAFFLRNAQPMGKISAA